MKNGDNKKEQHAKPSDDRFFQISLALPVLTPQVNPHARLGLK
jgi:hypothetical protein